MKVVAVTLTALACAIAAVLVAGGSAPAREPASTPAAAPSRTAPARLPRGFVGLVAEQTFAATGAERDAQLRAQAAAGVTLLRQTFDWSRIEVRRGQYELTYYDDYVLAAARAGIQVMPILFNPPAFRSSKPRLGAKRGTYPPKSNAAFGRFARAVVRRYGAKGSLWKGSNASLRPLHVRAWQVWNEPNIEVYWPSGPSGREYAAMVKVVGRAIRRADGRALVVAAGIPQSKLGVRFDRYVGDFLRARGRRYIDAFGVHPYGGTAAQAIGRIRGVRRFLNRRGARRVKLWVTEVGWATAGPPGPFTVGPDRQAEYATQLVTSLAALRRPLKLRGFVFYSWRDATPYPGGKDFWGLHAGLLTIDGARKPAYEAFSAANRAIAGG